MRLATKWILHLVFLLAVFAGPVCSAEEFELKSREDKVTLRFTPKKAGKLILTGRWEGSAKSLDVSVKTPTQFFAHWSGTVSKNPFELNINFSERDLEDSDRPWKIEIRTKSGNAKGDLDLTGDAIEEGDVSSEVKQKTSVRDPQQPTARSSPGKPDFTMPAPPAKDEVPALPLDEFGARSRAAFLETPYYKPWVEKIAAGKKPGKIQLQPLGLSVTPGQRKIQSRYGSLSVTVRNITLTPAQNINLTESVSGGIETRIELLMRVELPGWHLLSFQISPFAAYPGEPSRITAMQVTTRSLTRGEVTPPSSFPLSGAETVLLIPVLLSQPGEYLFSAQPIAREPAEVLFILGSIELYRISP